MCVRGQKVKPRTNCLVFVCAAYLRSFTASDRLTAMDDTPVQCPIINQNLRFVLTCCYAGIVVAKDIVAHFSLILIKPAETKVVPFVKCFIWAIPR